MSPEHIYDILCRLPALLLGLSFHECAHAAAADYCGDPTARYAGRLTLNPLAHLDPVGTLCILFAPIGWAKPVPVNPALLRHRYSDYIVSLAGVATNLGLAIVFGITARIMMALGANVTMYVWRIMFYGIVVNLGLLLFNLLPLHPLDGSHVMRELLPYKHKAAFDRFSRYAPFVLIALVLSGAIGVVLGRPLWFMADLLGGLELVLRAFVI